LSPNPTLCLVIVGGPNGSGKSTFARQAAGTKVLLGTSTINPDELTQAVARAVPAVAAEAANLIGVERAEKAVWRAIAEGKSVAIETVLSTDKFLPAVAAAALRGFRTRLVFVSLPEVEIAIARIRKQGADLQELQRSVVSPVANADHQRWRSAQGPCRHRSVQKTLDLD
jgi:predicted ABC-type ATPase